MESKFSSSQFYIIYKLVCSSSNPSLHPQLLKGPITTFRDTIKKLVILSPLFPFSYCHRMQRLHINFRALIFLHFTIIEPLEYPVLSFPFILLFKLKKIFTFYFHHNSLTELLPNKCIMYVSMCYIPNSTLIS